MQSTICVSLSYDARSVFSLFSMKYKSSCPLNWKTIYMSQNFVQMTHSFSWFSAPWCTFAALQPPYRLYRQLLLSILSPNGVLFQMHNSIPQHTVCHMIHFHCKNVWKKGSEEFLSYLILSLTYLPYIQHLDSQCWGSGSAYFGPPGSGFISQRVVSGSSSQRYGSGSFYHQAKIVRKNLDSYCFVTSLWLF